MDDQEESGRGTVTAHSTQLSPGQMHSWHAHHLLPISTAPSHSTPPLLTRSIALTGSLPVSSLLHIAVNHLAHPHTLTQRDDAPRSPKRARLESDATARHVVILTPSLPHLREALIAEMDLALFGHDRPPRTAGLLHQVSIK